MYLSPNASLSAKADKTVEELVTSAEQKIQQIAATVATALEEMGLRLDGMEMDTRPFAGLRVTMFVEKKAR